ncbi:MAG: hypothetical protein Kow00107_01700 [Planctomycetota bacterium]
MSNRVLIRTTLYLVGCCVVLLTAIGCEVNPATGKSELVLIGTQEEIRLGHSVHNELMGQYKEVKSEPFRRRTHAIGEKIARVTDRQDLEYSFTVLEADDLNAFAVPGGFVYVTTGLMRHADSDELACVVGHEFGHIAARHAVKKLQAQMLASLLMVLVAKETDKEEVAAAAAVALNLLMLGYSRKHEYEADLLGARYSWRAGYNPKGMSSFFRKLKTLNQNHASLPEFLSTHPDLDHRINAVDALILREMMGPDGKLLPPPILEPTNVPTVSNPS